ncbi:murein biosynthesis integral membrane protein MurJ [Nostocales cyanobacterium HT-58-2]|nr:murein biosynthesis integral membrane protein MurJ [Nostocales cyanobacterium HT-58-2]
MKIWQVQKLLTFWTNLTSGSTSRKIFGAAVTVGLLTALVKVVAFVKELVVAWKFGTGDTVDAFLIALVVPSFIFNVIADPFSAALIPNYIRVLEQQGKKAAQNLFSGVTAWALGLLAITTILIIAAAPVYLPRIATGFDQQKLDLTMHLLYVIAPVNLICVIIVILGAVLNAGERFALAALSPILTPAITILLLLKFKSWGVFALAGGLVGGAVLEMLILGVALNRQGVFLLPKLYKFDAHLRQVTGQYLPTIAGAFLICSSSIVDQSMAAMLSPGSVASLNYGYRVIASPISLISTALTAAVIPYFSKMVACQDWTGLRRTLESYIRLIFLASVPFMGLMLVFSERIVQLVFQRGSFTSEDTHLVAQIQSCFALQIPFYLGNVLLLKLIISMGKNKILIWVNGFNLLIDIILNYLFMQWIGIKGIALSTSSVYVFSFLILLFFANKQLNFYKRNAKINHGI